MARGDEATAGGAGVPVMRSRQAQAGTGGTLSRVGTPVHWTRTVRSPPGGTGTTGAPTR